MIEADSEPAPYVPAVLVLVPTGPRVTPVSMPVNMPGVPTGLQPRGVAKPDFCAVDVPVGALAGAVSRAADASMPAVPIAGGQSPRRDATADLAGAPLWSWTHAVRLSVVASASTTVATNAVFCMEWPPISPPGG